LYFAAASLAIIPKEKRGYKLNVKELVGLLKLINEIVPISIPEWDRVQDKHSEKYGDKEWTAESLKHKFQHLVCQKVPTGDPSCPEHIVLQRVFIRKLYLLQMAQREG
jgi:hypothetical protein